MTLTELREKFPYLRNPELALGRVYFGCKIKLAEISPDALAAANARRKIRDVFCVNCPATELDGDYQWISQTVESCTACTVAQKSVQ